MKKIYISGSINMDLVITTNTFPKEGMTVMGKNFMTNPGGKGANQAVAIAKSKGIAKMIGAVGTSFGNELLSTLNNYGVNTSSVKQLSTTSSGIAVIVISDNDNRIILDSGANSKVDINQIEDALQDATIGDYFLTQLEIPVDVVEESIKLAKKKGLVTILNPAPAQKINESIFKYLDYFIPNQSECEFYTGIYPKTIEEAIEGAKILLEKGVENVIITLGTLGAIFVNNETTEYVKAYPVKAIDTTAAGDTFVGYTISFLAKGKSIKEAIRYANLASSITVQKEGAQQAITTLEEIIEHEKKDNN